MALVYKDGITVDSNTGAVVGVGNKTGSAPQVKKLQTPGVQVTTNPQDVVQRAVPNYAPGATQPLEKPQAPSLVKLNPDGSRSMIDDYDSVLAQYWRNNPIQTVDETGIRNKYMQQQQASIKSIDDMYANILAQANQDNQGRLNETYAINANSGLRGSNIGQANTEKTKTANQGIIDSKLAEKAAKVQGIIDDFDKRIQDEIHYQTTLRQNNTEKYLDYLSSPYGPDAKRKELGLNARRDLIAARMKPADISDDQYQAMADAAGYTVDQMKALYAAEWKQGEDSFVADEQKKLADIAKTKSETAKNEAAAKEAATKNEVDLVAKGWRYIATPAERDKLVAQGRRTQVFNGRTYLAPLDELATYEAKKKLDLKYQKPGATPKIDNYDSTLSSLNSSKGADGFVNTDEYKRLRTAAKDKTAFDKNFGYMLNPNDSTAKAFMKATPTDNPAKWEQEATVRQWLATSEAKAMSDEQIADEILGFGFDPADFGY